jgi:hypothetical protein
MIIDDLTVGQLKDINRLLASGTGDTHQPYEIGANYQIRTVTFIYTGRVLSVGLHEIVITDAAWIADTGRFSQAVAGQSYSEIEPYPDGEPVIIGRGTVIDSVKIKSLPRSQK